jgi:nicotinamidase-related amidase
MRMAGENRFIQPLKAENSVLLIIDYQPQMLLGVESHDRTLIRNNVTALARGAKLLSVPTVLTSIGQDGFSGKFFPELLEIFPDIKLIDRTKMPSFDALDDSLVLDAVKKTGRKQLLVTGLWTSMCFAHSALHGLREGFQVYGVMDTAGSESLDAHNIAVNRMIQAGVVPVTWMQVVAEWLHDWAHPRGGDVAKLYGEYNAFFDKAGSYYASLKK